MKIDLRRSDKFVDEQRAKGNDVRWDGWKMIFFYPHNGGFFGGGVQRGGRFGFETTVEVDSKGFWNIPPALIV